MRVANRSQGTKHSAEVRFEDSAPHNLQLPSEARGLVLSAKAVLLEYSRSMVEACDAPNDYGRALEETVAVEARRRRAVATARLVEVAEDEQRREEKERDIKAKAIEVRPLTPLKTTKLMSAGPVSPIRRRRRKGRLHPAPPLGPHAWSPEPLTLSMNPPLPPFSAP
jgi:hypothetical protein